MVINFIVFLYCIPGSDSSRRPQVDVGNRVTVRQPVRAYHGVLARQHDRVVRPGRLRVGAVLAHGVDRLRGDGGRPRATALAGAAS